MVDLHLDVETYSSENIKTAGVYRYTASPDFEIMLIAYAFDSEPIKIIDLANGEEIPPLLSQALKDENVKKHAHNVPFERQAFKKSGYDIPIDQWYCSLVKAAYCGLPLSLDKVSEALKLEEKGKLSTGKALIKYFCVPCKPTKVNGGRLRNFPWHAPEKWEEFKLYCIGDVEAEREIGNQLENYQIPKFERDNYILDQQINDRGIKIDLVLARNAYKIDNIRSGHLSKEMIALTGLENPNSPAQLKTWLSEKMGREVTTLAKGEIPAMLEEAGEGEASEALRLRLKMAKSSTKKYTAMLNCVGAADRARGLFQFYGANRTGRWAGRLVQLQNLPQNHIPDLEVARSIIYSGDYDLTDMVYEDISDLLSQLIRTTFIAKEGHTFSVADFSAIEARVIAWLAGEEWRMKVFRTHGKIYEASAAMMFGVPMEQVTKGSDMRQKGKIAELALGYAGSKGALMTMGGEKMGLSEEEMINIVSVWRQTNPNIVRLWKRVEAGAKRAIETKTPVVLNNLEFDYDGFYLTIKLPSGRKLFYKNPIFTLNKFGNRSIQYEGTVQLTRQWGFIDTYGGKLVENIVQAVARDLLADSMLRLNAKGFDIVMHVHDEAICEVPENRAKESLEEMCKIMGDPIPWAKDLPLVADGYVTNFYKKD